MTISYWGDNQFLKKKKKKKKKTDEGQANTKFMQNIVVHGALYCRSTSERTCG